MGTVRVLSVQNAFGLSNCVNRKFLSAVVCTTVYAGARQERNAAVPICSECVPEKWMVMIVVMLQ